MANVEVGMRMTNPLRPRQVREGIPSCYPPPYSETDSGYSSIRDALPDQSEMDYAPSEISDSGWSTETPPYFKEERKDTITIASTQKIIEAALKETLSSQVRIVVYVMVVAAVLYFACSCYSREMAMKHVNIVLQSSSGDEMSAEFINQLKKEVAIELRAEHQAEREKHQASHSGLFYNVFGFFYCFFGILYHILGACYVLVVFIIKFCLCVPGLIFLYWLYRETTRRAGRK